MYVKPDPKLVAPPEGSVQWNRENQLRMLTGEALVRHHIEIMNGYLNFPCILRCTVVNPSV
jgi:hypothetical protein